MKMEARACRICLATGAGLRSLRQEPLKTAIDLVINTHNDPSSFPCYACYECAPLLLQCAKFIERTRKAHSVLFRIYSEYGEVTETAIQSLDKEQFNHSTNLTQHFTSPDEINNVQREEEDFIDDLPLPTILKEESQIKSEDEYMDVEYLEIKQHEESEPENIVLDVPKKQKKKKPKNDKQSLFRKTNAKKSKPTAKRKYKKREPKEENSKESEQGEAESAPRGGRATALDARLADCFTIVKLSYSEQVLEVERRRQSPRYGSAPYSCALCHKTYQREDSFSNHMAEHDPSHGAVECAVCRLRFSARRSLARHLQLAHERLYRCRRCPAVCRARQARAHMRRHAGEGEALSCAQCDFVTDQRYQYLRHVAAHGLRHECAACRRAFATARGLATHLKRGHAPGGAHRCAACALGFRSERAWRAHMAAHARRRAGASNVCQKCFASFETLEELTSHNNDQHALDNVYPRNCTICGAAVRSSRAAWLHVQRAHPALKAAYRSRAQPALCETCGKGCKSVTDLRLHALRHSGQRSVQCAQCPRTFYDHYQLRMHTRTVHVHTAPHACAVCSRPFKVKGNLTRHMLVHTGERPHACGVCGKRFSQAVSRDLHHRTVHLRLPPPPRAPRARRAPAPAAAPAPPLLSAE